MNGNGENAVASSSKISSPPPAAAQKSPRAAKQMSNLILPAWDISPAKPLHPSHDLISLLSLASLYNTYVRPYAQGVDEDAGQGGAGADGEGVKTEQVQGAAPAGAKGKGAARTKLAKLERGYAGLLEDCIDPVPDGDKAAPSLAPLITDLTYQPSGPPSEIWDGPIEILPVDKWNVATLEVGSQSGVGPLSNNRIKLMGQYKGGIKDGVQKAEEKRQRKREARALALQGLSRVPNADPQLGTNPLTPGPYSTPGTPLLPVAPPSKAGIAGFSSRRTESISGPGTGRPPPINPAQATSGPRSAGMVPGPGLDSAARAGAFRPNTAGARPSTPGTAGQPGSAQPAGVKRVYEGQGAGMSKKAKAGGTRSASPMPSSSLGKEGDVKAAQQGQGKSQTRPGLGKGGRARTEGW